MSVLLTQGSLRSVIITGLVKEFAQDEWNLEFIKKVAGSRSVTLKTSNATSTEWARLDTSRTSKVADFIDDLRGGQTEEYLFDWSLPLHCPELASKFQIPVYFQDDLLKRTSESALYHSSWPSLFVAPSGVKSHLHVDAFASNFWMVLLEGRKKWTFYHKDFMAHLEPIYDASLDPVFNLDLTSDRAKSMAKVEVILEPGEVLFVPFGSPHQVENLTDSVAVSGNFVDASNIHEVCRHLRRNSLCDPRAGDLLQEFVSKKWVS